MRQVAAPQRFFEQPAITPSVNSHTAGLNHLLLAIGRAMSPPVVHMRSTYQPMRVIVVHPDLISTIDRAAEWGCETPQLLPPTPHVNQNVKHEQSLWRQRIVHGEILSDESGRLYEKFGRRIRPVHQLASGPAGELIEMVPAERANLRVVPALETETKVPTRPTGAISDHQVHSETSPSNENKRFVPVQKSDPATDNRGYRKLFNDPGQWRVVTWGEFKEILAPQLSHPERLRDTYRLPCYVQVIETTRDVAIEELAKDSSTNGRAKTLYFLTGELAKKLELTSLLPQLQTGATDAGHRPTVVTAHQHVFRLLAANDPTVDVGTAPTKHSTRTNQSDPTTSITADPKKTQVPAAFAKEWEFKMSREEALYDMNSSGLWTALRNFARRLRLIKRQAELRKWQVLLGGKNHDEQLWSVRPPVKMLGDAFVLEWVRKTLEVAGYDPQKMIVEWEIFWRRRGSQ